MAEGDTDRLPLVNLRVEQSQKAKWESYVEESDMYTSLSDLIRKSVEKEIEGENHSKSTETEQLRSIFRPQMEDVKDELEQIRTDVSWLRSKEEFDREEFAHELFNILEPVPTDDPEDEAKAKGTIAGMNPQTVTDLAERLDTTPLRVREGLEFLKEQHMPVIKFEIDGETHWFKEE